MRNIAFFISVSFPLFSPTSSSIVWLLAADSPEKLLNRTFDSVKFLFCALNLDIGNCRINDALTMLYTIVHDASHPLHILFFSKYISFCENY